jgi:DNA polymerase III subunit beta
MSASVHTGELANTLKAADIIPPRVVTPVLGNILLRAKGDSISATASNLDGWLTFTASASVTEPFTACADPRIAKVVRALPEDSECKLAFKNDGLHLQCGRSRYKFECLPVESFPEAPTFEAGAQLTLSDEDVKHLFHQAAASVSTEETRYYLCGACLEIKDAQLRATSSNGHTLIRAAITAPPDAEALAWRPIIHGKACKVIAGMGACDIRLNDRLIEVRTDSQVLINKLIREKFPDADRIIPAPSGNSAEVDRDALLDALGRIKHVASRDLKNPSVKLDWSAKGDLYVSLPRSPDDAEDALTATTSGTASFSCQISYLTDMLKALATERITLDHGGGGGAIKIGAVGDDNVLAVVMPCRW